MLHQRDDVRDDLLDSVFSSQDLNVSMDKYPMPASEHEPHHVRQVVMDELMLDGNSRQNLATFCQTWAEPEVRELMDAVHRQEHDRQGRVPADRRARGALRAHARRPVELARGGEHDRDARRPARARPRCSAAWRCCGSGAQRRRAAGQPTDRPNLVTGPVQICWHKFARYWDVELREIPMEGDRLLMTPEEVARARRREHDRRRPDPRRDVHRASTSRSRPWPRRSTSSRPTHGLDVPIHVDAASGGFLAPFCDPELVWDFRLRASSRSTPRATSSGSRRSASAGSSGATQRTCPRT